MTTIKTIVCAIDLAKASRNAFDRALSMAAEVGAWALLIAPCGVPLAA